MKELTQKRLKERLEYNKYTGVFKWINPNPAARRIKKGDIAGRIHHTGYVYIGIDNNSYSAHRLVFLYMNGSFPKGHIDHINQIKSDNRFRNLRDVPQKENNKNMPLRSDNKYGITGIYWDKKLNTWFSSIWINGKHKNLGRSKSFLDACCVRKSAEHKYNFHVNHGANNG